MKIKKKIQPKYLVISLLSLALFIFAWYLVTDILGLFRPQALPSPTRVVQTLIQKFNRRPPDGATMFEHIWASLALAMYGFLLGAVIGIPVGILMAWNRRADLFITPIFNFLRPIPPIAWIPLMLIFFGIGQTAKAAVIFVSTVTNCILNSYAGIKQTKDVHQWVATTFGFRRTQILFKVAIPSALPMIFTGLSLSMNLAWMTLVAAEMLAADKGLGYLIQYARMMARVDLVIAGMIMITIIGAILNKVLTTIERAVVKGRHME